MTMKLIKASEMKVTKGGKEEERRKEKKERKGKDEKGKNGKDKNGEHWKKEDEVMEITSPIACITEKSITIISEDKVIHCERRESGATSNCAICEGITKEIFDKCKNKWTDY